MRISSPAPRQTSGLTLIEVTLVIAVLLGMISVTFVGVLAYKEGSNRALCLQNVSNVQKAMRSYCHFMQLEPGTSVTGLKTRIIDESRFFYSEPTCPSGGTYTYIDGVVPEMGTLYLRCSITDHVPAATPGW